MEDNKTNCASVEFDDSTENRNVATTSGNARDSKSGSVLISLRQKGNPVLKFIRSVPWQFDNIIPDYQFGPTSCALYLSLRYHNLNPDYIQERFKLLGNSYNLRVLLVLVDVKDPHHALKELGRICILTDCTLILAFSLEEAGRYLELYKSYENKPADLIMEKNETNYSAKLMDALTSLKKVNRSDALSLSSTFGSLTQIINATEENMSLCPGIGPLKAQKLHTVFHQPFSKNFKPGSK